MAKKSESFDVHSDNATSANGERKFHKSCSFEITYNQLTKLMPLLIFLRYKLSRICCNINLVHTLNTWLEHDTAFGRQEKKRERLECNSYILVPQEQEPENVKIISF